ncbi:MAG: hypothetical protein Q9227_004995 [Pyrenula ochraceoflavens]
MSTFNPPVSSSSSNTSPTSIPQLPGDISSQIDLLISLHLHSWPALTLAIQSHWGGPSGSDKRDWFSGAISELFSSDSLRDLEDLEDVMAQVMGDEFEVVVEDGSLEEVAGNIWKGRERLLKGDMGELGDLWKRWIENGGKGKKGNFVKGQGEGEDVEGGDEDEDEDEDGESDEEMGDAMELVDAVKSRDRVEPEVDDEGFTKVVGRRKR